MSLYRLYRQILENKDRFIDELDWYSYQKDDAKKFFRKHPNLENKVDWNKLEDFSYQDFLDLSDEYLDPINPDTTTELYDKRNEGNGIVSYEVEDTEEGQKAMRKIMDTHWGKRASPWCLLAMDEEGNLLPSSYDYWIHYDALPKRVAFKNGKLLAFMATDKIDSENLYDDSELAGRLPDRYNEYENWLETDEGREEMASFYEWMDVNYPEELEGASVQEQWWDRKNRTHPNLDFAR